MPPSIAKIAIPSPLAKLFDYQIPQEWLGLVTRGQRVQVNFGRQTLIGICLGLSDSSEVPSAKLRPLLSVLDPFPLLDEKHLTFLERVSDYYHYPLGEVIVNALTKELREGKAIRATGPLTHTTLGSPLPLNAAQTLARAALLEQRGSFSSTVLFGVTGSGKTQVYTETLEALILEGKQALIMVPEIALTPQMIERFVNRFGDRVWCYHSKMTEKQRAITWHRAREGTAPIIIGTRSAIFLPFADLGMIIVDEEHESSYKQQEGFKYCARDLAILRASQIGIPVVLGSATPSFTSLYNWKANKAQFLSLPTKANGLDANPLTLIDIRHKKLQSGLSSLLIEMIKETLTKKQQVLIFLNRRGFSPSLYCADCQWLAECSACDARLTYHQSLNAMLCHHCQRRSPKPLTCPSCKSENVCLLGQGTERVEETLKELFPDEVVVRLDTDTTSKKGALESKLQQIHDQEASIILGTQMLSKGHDFPHVTLAAILDVDGGLFSSDFRAIERMGQTIVQVAGRAGRSQHPGKVALQTMQPEHPILNTLLNDGYLVFAQTILEERQALGLPPYQYMALLSVTAPQLETAMTFLNTIKAQLPRSVQMIGPLPATMQKRLGLFRAGLIFQSPQRSSLHPFLRQLNRHLNTLKMPRQVRWDLDIDPHQML